ncbi:MAG: EAL-associated domain-containing protein, partial [Bacillota bacterium]|nr:EAL-associated domain-containing protein [Bacillota bacterium]
YEVLGRFLEEKEAISLGSFFRDEQIPDEYKVEVDSLLLEKALSGVINFESDSKLFINRSAEQLMYDNGEPFLEQLLKFEKKGFRLNRIVLEISDGHYNGDYHQLVHLLTYYRTYGIQIAVAKKDFDNSTMDLIGLLEPNILKINLSSLRSTATSIAFQDIMFTLSLLARKIGATLLFENIETSYQLQFAWSNGGRYYQGYYLGKPSEHFIEENSLKNRLKEEFHGFILLEKKKLQAIYTTEETFHFKVQSLIAKYKKTGYEELFHLLMKEMEKIAFRMYVCDEDGFQLSANFSKIPVIGWVTQKEYIKKNWSWRPYFLENIIEMRNEKRGILSDPYSDIETGEQIRTFSFPINANEFLFIDISSHYLYEQEGLV